MVTDCGISWLPKASQQATTTAVVPKLCATVTLVTDENDVEYLFISFYVVMSTKPVRAVDATLKVANN